MISKIRKQFTSFACLNTTQFFSALNDNIYKLLLVFLLINIKGVEHSNTILALAGAIFVIPFILFASLAGTLADRFSKQTIIYLTRIGEVFILTLGVMAFATSSAVFGYIVLFLMAAQSALFSPAKYGVLPEIVSQKKISHCNGILTATTYFAIILGTFLASFLTDITNKKFVFAALFPVAFASIGAAFSIGIKKTTAKAPEKKVSARFITDIFRTIKRAKKYRYLVTVIVFGAYFLFMGAYTQLNIIPFAMQSLGLTEIGGGYLFLMTAIGIGIGSFFAGRFAGQEIELGFIPLAALGLGIASFALFLFSSNFYAVVSILVILGILSGFYIVPIDAFIQVASPNEDRGQNVAAANFLSFIGVIMAAALIAILGNTLGLTAAQGFLIVGMITLLVGCFLVLLMADQVLRLIVAKLARFFWKLEVTGRQHLRLTPPTLLIGQRISWLDTIIVMAILPRLIRYIVPIKGRFLKGRSIIYRLLRLVPVDMQHFSPVGQPTMDEVEKELSLGHSVCLMLPVDAAANTLDAWKKNLKALMHDYDIPSVVIHITREATHPNETYRSQIKTLFKYPIKVAYGINLKDN